MIRTTSMLLALLLGLVSHSAAAQSLSVQASASRSDGTAPVAVFFDARGTTSGDSSIDAFTDLTYEWDFGDPGSGDWAHSGLPKNQASGPLATHVFESAGTYTATLRVKYGTVEVAASPMTIAVSDPDSVYAGSATVCVRASSSGTFSGCPSGAVQVTSSDFDSTLASNVAPGMRVLFSRGDTFTSNATYTIGASGPGTIGAYGSGSPPLINSANSNDVINVSNSFSDWRVMDLDADGHEHGGSFLGKGGTVDSLLVLRVNMRNYLIPIQSPAAGKTPGGSNMHDQLAIIESSSLSRTYNGTDFYGGGERLSFMGNDFGDADGKQHILRFHWLDGAVISHNRLGRDLGTAVHVIKLHDIMPYPTCSEEMVISSNLIEGGPNTRIIDIGPVSNSSSAYDDECIQKVVYEGNHHRFSQGVTGTGTMLYFRGGDSVLRNNVFDLTGDYGSLRGLFVNTRMASQIRRPTHNRIYNNTCYSSKPGTNDLVTCITLAGSAEDTLVSNNLLYAPVSGTTKVLADGGVRTVTCGGAGTSCNLVASSNPFVSAQPFAIGDFALHSTSVALDTGADVPANVRDYLGAIRPTDGDQDGSIIADIGAFEVSGTGNPTSAPTTTTTTSGTSPPPASPPAPPTLLP